MFSAIFVALKISSWISDIWNSYLLIVKAWNRLSWLKIKCNFWSSVIYKLMKLKWLLITTYSYHIKSFHTLVQKMLSHTGWILSHPLDRESVCKFFPWERRASLGSCGGPWRSNPRFDLTRFLSYVLVMTYPKIILLGLVVSEEIGVKVFRYFFALSFIR